MRILLVEDDPLLGDGIHCALKLANYAVDWVRDGETAKLALLDHTYAACVLDLGLPGEDGLSILKRLRQQGSPLPVLILTARDSKEDRILGLNSGADDYLTKPFDLSELHARLRALIRRASGISTAQLVYGAVNLDPATKKVTLHSQPITLSSREYTILHDFLTHQEHIRSREQLAESLYGWGDEPEGNIIEVYIHRLRKIFGSHFIITVRGLGYQLGKLDG